MRRGRQTVIGVASRLTVLQKALSDDDFAADQRTAVADLEIAIAELGYDEQNLEAATVKARSLQRWDAELRKLRDDRARLSEDETSLVQTESRLGRLKQELAAVEAFLVEASEAVADLPEREREGIDAEQGRGESLCRA